MDAENMVYVYQRIEPTFYESRSDGILNKNEFSLVALVATQDLDKAYMQTNTIQHYWWKNRDVIHVFEAEGCRSTSVGDALEVHGRLYEVASFGFTEVTWSTASISAT